MTLRVCLCGSVGGLDYGTVRAGAFMGLRMLSSLASELQRQGSYQSPSKTRPKAATNGVHCSPIGTYMLPLHVAGNHLLMLHRTFMWVV